jgi:hypothetical protein
MAWSTVSRARSIRTEAKGDRSNEMSDEPILSRCDSHDLRLRPQLASMAAVGLSELLRRKGYLL